MLIVEYLEPPICEWCHTVFERRDTGRPRVFCCDRCKQAAYRLRVEDERRLVAYRNKFRQSVTKSPIVVSDRAARASCKTSRA